jgi:hypothetical protein
MTTLTLPDELNAYSLASLADCATPDTQESPGAAFLLRVQDATREAVEEIDDPEDIEREMQDRAHEIADTAVPVYTHDCWQVFVDLGAYNEDASELGADASDLTTAAGVALYMIAERVVTALVTEYVAALAESVQS